MNQSVALRGNRLNRALAVAALTIWLGGCSNGDCGGAALHGLRIRVVDARTQRSLEQMATVTATEGAYTEVLTIDYSRPNERLYLGASERSGTYTVQVEAPGYAATTRTDLTVTRNRRCGDIRPLEVTIAMTPSAP